MYEHTAQMSHIINKARLKQRSVVITLLNLRKTFGEVHHNLIPAVLKFHHIPHHIIIIIIIVSLSRHCWQMASTAVSMQLCQERLSSSYFQPSLQSCPSIFSFVFLLLFFNLLGSIQLLFWPIFCLPFLPRVQPICFSGLLLL